MRTLHSFLCLFACVLFAGLNQGTSRMSVREMSAQKKADHPQTGIAKAAPSEESPMDRLGNLIAGTWAIDATSEPREPGSKGGKDAGRSVIQFGPSKLALIEDYRTQGDDGTRAALGLFWFDGTAQGYRTMFCEQRDPNGCSVYDGLGNWEGADWIFHAQFDTKDKKKVKVKEILSATSPSSFKAAFYRSVDDGPFKLDWTVKHTRVTAP